VTALFLFGSASRAEAGRDSDVDLFLDHDPEARFSLFDQMEFEDILTAKLGRKVDLLTRNGLHPLIKDEIVASAIRMF
jgi:predicted nucleotidyltransferase